MTIPASRLMNPEERAAWNAWVQKCKAQEKTHLGFVISGRPAGTPTDTLLDTLQRGEQPA